MPEFPSWFHRVASVRELRSRVHRIAATTDAWYYETRRGQRSRKFKIASVVSGSVLAAVAAYAATNWTVGLTGGSSGESQSASVSNLTISAVASPAATNVLFPGGNGDVVVTITNPNSIPVTVTGVNLPTNLTFAAGFTTSALSTA